MDGQTIGARLLELKQRAGMSLGAIAKAAGYSGPSSVQAFFRHDYDPTHLDIDVAHRLTDALVGRGSPPISEIEIFDLVRTWGQREGSHVLQDFSVGSKDVPILSSRNEMISIADAFNGEEQEGQILNYQFPVDYTYRSAWLVARKTAYVFHVTNTSMAPRFEMGEAVCADPYRPPSIGDYVALVIRAEEQEGHWTIMIRRLLKQEAAFLELERLTPHAVQRVGVQHVTEMHRIASWRDLLAIY